MRFRVVLAVALLATTASLAVAQITSATISGTIKDETGGVLPGVDVVVKNVDTGLTRCKYAARARLRGFATGIQTLVLDDAAHPPLSRPASVASTSEITIVTG